MSSNCSRPGCSSARSGSLCCSPARCMNSTAGQHLWVKQEARGSEPASRTSGEPYQRLPSPHRMERHRSVPSRRLTRRGKSPKTSDTLHRGLCQPTSPWSAKAHSLCCGSLLGNLKLYQMPVVPERGGKGASNWSHLEKAPWGTRLGSGTERYFLNPLVLLGTKVHLSLFPKPSLPLSLS